MTENTADIETTPETVWEVLCDGWLYPLWVVGATRMRAVDDSWPQPGSKLHHSAGVWPAVLDDETEVLECQPGRLLRLRAAGWPMGEAEVLITVAPHGSHTRVVLQEDASAGPGRFVPGPVRKPLIRWRNRETLRRLTFLAEGRATAE
ncbi:MAG: SRPBCC family protein [Nocardioidaceae bacterium]